VLLPSLSHARTPQPPAALCPPLQANESRLTTTFLFLSSALRLRWVAACRCAGLLYHCLPAGWAWISLPHARGRDPNACRRWVKPLTSGGGESATCHAIRGPLF
jgi:hypothetical protein